MKLLLNIFNLGLFILFCLALISGIHLNPVPAKLGSHLGWILGAMLLWLFTVIFYMMYLYRMEKFCVEIVEKYEGPNKKDTAMSSTTHSADSTSQNKPAELS